jgi:hypothetical protein
MVILLRQYQWEDAIRHVNHSIYNGVPVFMIGPDWCISVNVALAPKLEELPIAVPESYVSYQPQTPMLTRVIAHMIASWKKGSEEHALQQPSEDGPVQQMLMEPRQLDEEDNTAPKVDEEGIMSGAESEQQGQSLTEEPHVDDSGNTTTVTAGNNAQMDPNKFYAACVRSDCC